MFIVFYDETINIFCYFICMNPWLKFNDIVRFSWTVIFHMLFTLKKRRRESSRDLLWHFNFPPLYSTSPKPSIPSHEPLFIFFFLNPISLRASFRKKVEGEDPYSAFFMKSTVSVIFLKANSSRGWLFISAENWVFFFIFSRDPTQDLGVTAFLQNTILCFGDFCTQVAGDFSFLQRIVYFFFIFSRDPTQDLGVAAFLQNTKLCFGDFRLYFCMDNGEDLGGFRSYKSARK